MARPSRLLAVPLRWLAAGLDFALGGSLESRGTEHEEGDTPVPTRLRGGLGGSTVAFDSEVAPTLRTVPPAPPAGNEAGEAATSPALPKTLSTDRLVVLPRTPESAFAFWDVSSEAVARARTQSGRPSAPVRLRVRVCPADGRGEPVSGEYDVALAPGARSHYVTELPPDSELEVSIGIGDATRFFEFATAAPIRTPPRRPHPPGVTRWRDHTTGREVRGYEGIAGTTPTSPEDLDRNLPPSPPAGAPLAVTTPAPNPRAVPARR